MHSAGIGDVERRHGNEEDVVQVGRFEYDVHEAVEKVPYEEDADPGCGWVAQNR